MINYKIYLTKKTNKGKVSKDESFITDGKMVTRHNDPNDTFNIYLEKRKKKESVKWRRGILLEYFEGKTAGEIRDHVVKEMEIMKKNMGDDMELDWRIEKC